MNYLDGDWGADCASLDKHLGVQRLDPTKRPVCARRRGEELMTSNLCSYLALANTLSLGFKQLQINCFKGTSEEVRRGNPPSSLKLKPFTLLSDLKLFNPLRISNLIHPCLVSSAVICCLAYWIHLQKPLLSHTEKSAGLARRTPCLLNTLLIRSRARLTLISALTGANEHSDVYVYPPSE